MPPGLDGDLLRKPPTSGPPPVLQDWTEARGTFSWEAVAAALDVSPGGPFNLGELAVRRGGSLVWLGAEGQGERHSAAELEQHSGRFARALGEAGLSPGDRVAFVARSRPELVAGLLGSLRFGAVPLALARPRQPDGLRAALAVSGAALAVVDPDLKPSLEAWRESLPSLRHVWTIGPGGSWTPGSGPSEFRGPSLPPDHRAWMHVVDGASPPALYGHRAALGLFASAGAALDLRAGDAALVLAVPGDTLYLPYVLLAPLLAGATTYVLEDPARFVRFGSIGKVHVWLSATRGLDLVLRNDPGLGQLLSGCRHIAVTHPYDAELVRLTQISYGSPLHPVWLPRDAGCIQTAEFRAHDLRLGSVGRPLPGADVRLDAETGRLSIRVTPGLPFTAYWNDAEATARRVRNGWFVSDQAGKMDPDGYAWVAS